MLHLHRKAYEELLQWKENGASAFRRIWHFIYSD